MACIAVWKTVANLAEGKLSILFDLMPEISDPVPELALEPSVNQINPLNTKRRLLYLKTQFVPRSKHFSSLL